MKGNEIFPLVSIVITSYNRANLISNAIESALSQDYPNLEFIISDNNSTDNTDEIISKYLNDSRVRYSKNETNVGMLNNFKRATDLSQGKYITYISSDDYLVNNSFVSEAIELISQNDNVVAVFAKEQVLEYKTNRVLSVNDCSYFKNRVMKGSEVFKLFPKTGGLSFAASLMNKNKLLETKMYDQEGLFKDCEAGLKLCLLGDIGFIDKIAYTVLIHGANTSQYLTTSNQYLQKIVDCAELPYEFAKKSSKISINELEDWRKKSVLRDIKSGFKKLYKLKNNEFDTFLQQVNHLYPEMIKELRGVGKWSLFLLIIPLYRKLFIS